MEKLFSDAFGSRKERIFNFVLLISLFMMMLEETLHPVSVLMFHHGFAGALFVSCLVVLYYLIEYYYADAKPSFFGWFCIFASFTITVYLAMPVMVNWVNNSISPALDRVVEMLWRYCHNIQNQINWKLYQVHISTFV